MDFIEIKPGQDLKTFNDVRAELYSGPVNPDSPAKEHLHACYILTDHNKPIGRFALYRNPDLFYKTIPAVCIGNYECVDDILSSYILLQKAMDESKKLGAGVLIGPMNGSIWENYRFAHNITDEHFFLEPYNHSYYNQQFSGFGFETIGDYCSMVDDNFNYKKTGIDQREKQLLDSGYIFRNIDPDKYHEELQKIFQLSSLSFRNSFLYTAISRESFYEKYLPYLLFLDPEYIVMAEDASGNLMGYIFCVEDMSHRFNKRIIIKTIARLPGKEAAGIGEILGKIIYEHAIQHGYKSVIHALMRTKGISALHSLRRTHKIINTYSLYAKFI